MLENQGLCKKMSIKVITGLLTLMKAGKAAGPSGVTSEFLKVCKIESVEKLA